MVYRRVSKPSFGNSHIHKKDAPSTTSAMPVQAKSVPASPQEQEMPSYTPLATNWATTNNLMRSLSENTPTQVEAGVQLPSSSGGEPMPEAVQQKMETAFGADFSDVRIHEGSNAQSIGAVAYTQGSDIHFAPGKHDPMSQAGQELLGHELAHVVQQRAGRVAVPQGKGVPINADPQLENEADVLGAKAAQGKRIASPQGLAPLQFKKQSHVSSGVIQALRRSEGMPEPHKDIGFFARSTAYKVVLTNLDSYNQEADKNQVAQTAPKRDEVAQLLNDRLDGVELSATNYTSTHQDDDKANAVNQLINEIPAERTLIDQVKDEKAYDQAANRRSWTESMVLARTRVIPRPRIRANNFTDANLKGEFKPLGSGAVNTVYEGKYKDEKASFVYKEEKHGTQVNVEGELGIPDQDRNYAARNVAMYKLNQLLGLDVIPRTEFAIHEGYLGTVMEKVEGTEAVKQQVGVLQEGSHAAGEAEANIEAFYGEYSPQENKEAAQKAIEKNKYSYDPKKKQYFGQQDYDRGIDYDSPALKKALANLQLIDSIAGSGDRHVKNYLIETDKKGRPMGVKGIDNDFAFGQNTDPNAIVSGQPNNIQGFGNITASHNPGMPEVLDFEVAKRIRDTPPQSVKNTLHGLLEDSEIDATVARYTTIRQRVIQMLQNDQTVSDWSQGNLMTNEKTSYYARDKAYLEDLRQKGRITKK